MGGKGWPWGSDMALGGSCCPCENLVTLLPSEVTDPTGWGCCGGGLGQGSKVWKVTDLGIGISVMKDQRIGPYLVPVWDERGGGKGDLSRSVSAIPQGERGWARE